MRLLLTGASGFFGRNLVEALERRQAGGGPPVELHLTTRGGTAAAGKFGAAVSVHQVDLLDHPQVTALVGDVRPTHLCHLAWVGPEHQDRYNTPENDRWTDASAVLFEAFADVDGRRLVQLGSCIEYGNSASGIRTESQPLAPDTAYGEAKAKVSELVESLGRDLSTAIVRPFFCYGPYEQRERLVPSLILGLQKGEPIDLTEGRQRRDYLDVRDIASALMTMLTDDEATGAFNVGSGVGVEVRAIAELLGQIAGRPDLLNFGARPDGADSAAEIVADIDRITTTTDWKPTITLDQGLRSATKWWLEDGPLGPKRVEEANT